MFNLLKKSFEIFLKLWGQLKGTKLLSRTRASELLGDRIRECEQFLLFWIE
jgi:hypothetical protein